MFDRLVSNKALLGAYFTLLIFELVNWGFTVVWTLGIYVDSGSAINFVPYLIPTIWPILPAFLPALDPLGLYVGAAIFFVTVFGCYVGVVALIFRWTPQPWTLERRKKAVLYSGLAFVGLYVVSFPFLALWNA